MSPSPFAALTEPFTYAQALEAGLSKHRFYQLRDEGEIQPLARGLYLRAEPNLADIDLVEIAMRSPRATLCLTSALVQHGLSDAIPRAHDVAIPRGARAPVVSVPVQWHRFDTAMFDVGRHSRRLGRGVEIGVYSAERTILDAFRTRRTEGNELGYEALKRWLRKPGHQPSALLELSKYFPRTTRSLRQALEILL